MDKTIGDLLGRVVHVTRYDLHEMRKSKYGVMKFLSMEAKHKEVYKITFETGEELKYSDLRMYSEHDGPVDDGDITKYYDTRNANKNWVFHRKLFGSNESCKTDGIARILTELKLRGLQDGLTIQNIRKLVPAQPMIKVNETTSIKTFDKKIIQRIAGLKTVQVVNCGQEENDDANVFHPFALCRIFSLEKLILPSEENVEIPGIFIPYYYYSFRWSHTAFHIEDNCYVSINIHAGGADKVWTCVPASHEKMFWEKVQDLKSENPKYSDDCTAFMRTKSVLITHHQLDEWKIPYTIFIQRKGEVIITPVCCPHQVISLGECVNHTVNLIDPAWCRLSKDDKYICDDMELHDGAHGGCRLNVNSMGLLKRYMDKLAEELAESGTSQLIEATPTVTSSSSAHTNIDHPSSKPLGRKRARTPLDHLSFIDIGTQPSDKPTSADSDGVCIACKCTHQTGLCRGLGCINCGIDYCSIYATRMHIMKVHNGGKKPDAKYKCNLCNKSYSEKRNLNRHKRHSHV